jgi:hypothetical protein
MFVSATSARTREYVQANARSDKARSARCVALRCESRKYEQSALAVQAIALMLIETRCRDHCISHALAATSQRQRFALPWHGAGYNILF